MIQICYFYFTYKKQRQKMAVRVVFHRKRVVMSSRPILRGILSLFFGTKPNRDEQARIIQEWDLSDVRKRMHNKRGIPMDDLYTLEVEYKKYLILCLETPNTCFALSVPVDEMLHEHMLFTDNFKAFEAAIGHRFRHQPTLSKEEELALVDDYNERTLGGLETRFGSYDATHWPIGAPICFGKLCTY